MKLTELEEKILSNAQNDIRALRYSSLDNKVHIINELKKMLHNESPFNTEPVDCARPASLVLAAPNFAEICESGSGSSQLADLKIKN